MRTHELRLRSHAAAPLAALAMVVASLLVESVLANVLLTVAAALTVVRIGRRASPPTFAVIRMQALALEHKRIMHSAYQCSFMAFALATGCLMMLVSGRANGLWAAPFWFAVIAGTLTCGNCIALLLRQYSPSSRG